MPPDEIIQQLTPLDYFLVMGIIWVSGVLLWIVRRFLKAGEDHAQVIVKNTEAMATVGHTLQGIDRKLERAAQIDEQILTRLVEIKAYTTRSERPAMRDRAAARAMET